MSFCKMRVFAGNCAFCRFSSKILRLEYHCTPTVKVEFEFLNKNSIFSSLNEHNFLILLFEFAIFANKCDNCRFAKLHLFADDVLVLRLERPLIFLSTKTVLSYSDCPFILSAKREITFRGVTLSSYPNTSYNL